MQNERRKTKMRKIIGAVVCLIVLCTVPVLSGEFGTEKAGPWRLCFFLDDYGDTWVLIIENVGGGVYRVTGYDSAYPGGLPLNGSGVVQEGHFIFTMRAGWPTNPYYAGAYASYACDVDLQTWTGTADVTFYDCADGMPYVSVCDVAFHRISCATAQAGSTTGRPILGQPQP
jgi:hypothetical protein